MSDDTTDLRRQDAQTALAEGMRLAKQGSYARRAPASEAVPYLHHAKSILMSLPGWGNDPKALRDLSIIEECLLNFEPAIKYLEQAISHGPGPSKRDLKRLAMLRQTSKNWRSLGLTPTQLSDLGDYLRRLNVGPFHRTLDLTREWLTIAGVEDPTSVICALAGAGAFSDFQVLENIVRG